jgi:hypothetical protein
MKFINQIKSAIASLKNRFDRAMIAVMVFVCSNEAIAQGGVGIASNTTRFIQALVTLLIAVGVLAGLGVILMAIMQMVKKGDQRGEDITWGSIALKFLGGAFLLALSWVGTMVLETLGGNAGNIGRSVGF